MAERGSRAAPPGGYVSGAPRRGRRFQNLTAPEVRAPVLDLLAYALRRARVSIAPPRPGAAELVAFDVGAIVRNPSITWIGHATFLVRLDGVSFLTDPVFSDTAGPLPGVGVRRLVPPGVPLRALPTVDFALLSHDHYDHADLPSIRALARRGVRFFVPLRVGDLVRRAGGEATELDWWQTAEFRSVRVHCVPAQHFCGRAIVDRNRRLWAGWIVEGPTRRFYHAGDTGYFAGFAEIGRRFGSPDLAAVPIGAYEPASVMRPVHLNPEEAVRAGCEMGAKRLVAMHFGTFDLTDEPLAEPPERFRAAAAAAGLGADRAWTMAIGEARAW